MADRREDGAIALAIGHNNRAMHLANKAHQLQQTFVNSTQAPILAIQSLREATSAIAHLIGIAERAHDRDPQPDGPELAELLYLPTAPLSAMEARTDALHWILGSVGGMIETGLLDGDTGLRDTMAQKLAVVGYPVNDALRTADTRS